MHFQEVGGLRSKGNCHRHRMDECAAVLPHAFAPTNLPVAAISPCAHIACFGFHNDGLAVVVERELRHRQIHPASFAAAKGSPAIPPPADAVKTTLVRMP